MKKILGFLLAVGMMVGVVSFSGVMSGEAYAASCSDNTFLGMRAWYYGLDCGTDGKTPGPGVIETDNDDTKEAKMKAFVWTIVGNIAFDLLLIVGIVAVGYIIYSGYVYMTADGDPGKIGKAKKALTASIVGVFISILARSIIVLLLGSMVVGSLKTNDPSLVLRELFNLATSFGGIIATGFVIMGGVMYITSAGDPGKVRKAKTTIIYALIGLVIVVASYSIVNFILGSV